MLLRAGVSSRKLVKIFNTLFYAQKRPQLWGNYVPNFKGLAALEPPLPPKKGVERGPEIYLFIADKTSVYHGRWYIYLKILFSGKTKA